MNKICFVIIVIQKKLFNDVKSESYILLKKVHEDNY